MAIRNGSTGIGVRLLQEKLGITQDGNFGPGTERAVREWQTKNKVTVDGVVSFDNWERMFGLTFDLNRLVGIIPNDVIFQLPIIMQRYQINTSLRLAHFLAQCQHESGNFSVIFENLNYSAQGLLNTFPRYFNAQTAAQFARQPERIANHVYANRMGNGNTQSGDGFRFRGRGYIQLTGRENYRLFTQSIGEDCVTNPDLVANKYPLASAGWFFSRNGLNSIADRGATDQVVTLVSRRVNGGTIGLEDRIKKFREIFDKIK